MRLRCGGNVPEAAAGISGQECWKGSTDSITPAMPLEEAVLYWWNSDHERIGARGEHTAWIFGVERTRRTTKPIFNINLVRPSSPFSIRKGLRQSHRNGILMAPSPYLPCPIMIASALAATCKSITVNGQLPRCLSCSGRGRRWDNRWVRRMGTDFGRQSPGAMLRYLFAMRFSAWPGSS